MAAYEYIFIWDEDLGVENFNAEEYASYFLIKYIIGIFFFLFLVKGKLRLKGLLEVQLNL